MTENVMETYEAMMADPEIEEEMKQELEALKTAGKLEDFFDFLASQEEETETEAADSAAEIFDKLKAFFEDEGWKYIADEKKQVAVLGFRMRHATIKVYVRLEGEKECIRINTVLPVICRPEYRLILANELVKINLHLRYGCFHLDPEDGEITFRFTYSYAGEGFNAEKFDDYLDVCTICPDAEFDSINRIASGQLDSEAVEGYLDAIETLIAAMKG